ncbi:unnamed protein product [Nesidiocoris tenuis]|uniref:Uncharacterized protein n=1 Tax=Nesidiocoris tenuis TaxID=355587 RepID=A0A6H5H8Z5_9HEMI|nr:unnamed protein product [Nesidiocoris tenuis]
MVQNDRVGCIFMSFHIKNCSVTTLIDQPEPNLVRPPIMTTNCSSSTTKQKQRLNWFIFDARKKNQWCSSIDVS